MAKGKRVKKKQPFVDIYGVLLLVATLVMSIGYAEIVGTTVTVETRAEASAQEGVFITDIVTTENNVAVNNYLATTMDTSVKLDSPTATKKFTVTIYNKTVKPQVFIGVIKSDKMDEFTGNYTNTNISYTLEEKMVPHGYILAPKTYVVFDVNLGFNGQGTMPEILRSLLNFRFQEAPTIQISDIATIENVSPGYTPQEIEFTVTNQRQDAEHGLITNGVPLTYTIAPNVPAPLTAKIYDENGQEVANNKAITISSEAKEEHTYKLKIFWDNTNPVQGKEYNSAEYAGQTLASSIKIIATPIDENNKYLGYERIEEKAFEVKTEPMYFGISTDKTTVEMNNTTNAENIILTIKNNDGTQNTTNINKLETEYKLSIDNSKFTLLVDGSEIGEEQQTLGNTVAIAQPHELQLVSKIGQELEATENCNLTIEAISPYAKTETITITISDTKGPTAPVIQGGSTGVYATEQTISVSEVSTDVGTGINKYQYLLNSDGIKTAEATADVTTTATSQTFTQDAPGYYVYFRAVDKAGNVGEWSNAQQIYIDTNPPTVVLADGVSTEITIEEGTQNDVVSYFKYDKNGNAGIKEVTYTINGKTIANTSELTEGTHTITCTVTKDTNISKTASITIIVEAAPTIATDGSWNGKVNNPLLMSGMTAVYWSTDGGVTASTTEEGATPIYSKVGGVSTGADNPNFVWKNWYKYVAGDNLADTKTSRWANAVTDDGSYWVWVPRYKYLITDKPTTAGIIKAGKIDIKFIPTTDKSGASGYTTAANSESEMLTTDSDGYIIHPAFENGDADGKNNGFANGEWDKDLPGFWVAKYEMSMEDADGNNVNTSSSSIGNVKISSSAKMVSKPGVQSWRYIQIGQIYQNCLEYDEAKGSHMIKNSEWGATAYLTHSQYGRNGNEIYINDSSGYYTGNAGDSPKDSSTQSTIGHAYNTTAGMLASTTGNIYGVYDMSGGAYEYTAGWDTKASTSSYGKDKEGTQWFAQNGTSDKYKTAYSNGTSTYCGETVKTVCRTGDAVKEVWISSSSAWFNDDSYFVSSSSPFFSRGGGCIYGSTAGVFYSNDISGIAISGASFRAVLSKGIVDVEPVTETLEITEGTENTFASLFTVTTVDGGTATKTYTLNGTTTNIRNTSELAVGTYTITCTATYNGVSDSASVTIVVESAGPASITTATSIQSATTPFIDGTGKNTVVVPGGFKVRTDLATTVDKGIVIEDSDGNQFVWVPIGTITKSDGTKVTIDLGRYTFASDGTPTLKQAASNYTAEVRLPEDYSLNTSHIAELTTSRVGSSSTNATAINLAQFISKTTSNKGYYIARYEASSSSTGNSKSGLAPTTAITQPNASVAARKMYNGNSYVVSDLVNSYMWDTAIVYIQKCSSKTNYAYQGTSDGKTYNTGASSDVVCNIYDMSGSVCEWGTEHSNYVEFDEEFGYEYDCPCVFMGIWMSNGYVAAGKNSLEATFLDSKIGFRVGLYVL